MASSKKIESENETFRPVAFAVMLSTLESVAGRCKGFEVKAPRASRYLRVNYGGPKAGGVGYIATLNRVNLGKGPVGSLHLYQAASHWAGGVYKGGGADMVFSVAENSPLAKLQAIDGVRVIANGAASVFSRCRYTTLVAGTPKAAQAIGEFIGMVATAKADADALLQFGQATRYSVPKADAPKADAPKADAPKA